MQNKDSIIKLAKEAIAAERDAVNELINRIGDDFITACELIASCAGRVIVTGMGKSSHIASKIAATFASTGTPAFFVHPGEASHGDIGVVVEKDVVLAISNSGNTPEIVAILPVIKKRNVPLISMTGDASSILAREANVNLDVSVVKEACPIGLAPTSSTTVALVMGDALAITLLKMRGFTAEDFARSHPGGILGRRLSLLVDDVMHTGDAIPKVAFDAVLNKALLEVTQKKMGMTAVVDADGKLLGVFTDGDLRRAIEKECDIHRTKIVDVMTKGCKTIPGGTLAIDALRLMEQYFITSLLVLDENAAIIGVLHMHDILRVGLR